MFSNGGKGCGYGVECNARVPVRGVCPAGWHLPSDAEWWTLFESIGDTSIAGKKLKSTSGWYDDDNGMDTYGFSVLPAGIHDGDGSYRTAGKHAGLWGSTENSSYAYYWFFAYDSERVGSGYTYKNEGFSIRCIKD